MYPTDRPEKEFAEIARQMFGKAVILAIVVTNK